MDLATRASGQAALVAMSDVRFAATRAAAKPYANWPNAISLVGYAAQLAWVAGFSWHWAIVGLVADEIDGRLARAVDATSDFGGNLDWAIDLTMTGLTAMRAGVLWTLPFTTVLQTSMRTRGLRPTCGSARAFYTALSLARLR